MFQWLLVGITGFLLLAFGLLYVFARVERRRVDAWNTQLFTDSDQTGNTTYSTLLANTDVIDNPAYVLETSTNEQETYLLDTAVTIRSTSTWQCLTIDWGMNDTQLATVEPPEYSCAAPTGGTHVGMHPVSSTRSFRGRLADWTIIRAQEQSTVDQSYVLVPHFFPTVVLSAAQPSTLVTDPFLINRETKTSVNAIEFVFTAFNTYLIRQPLTRRFLVETVGGSVAWGPVNYATAWMLLPSLTNELNNPFPRLLLDRYTQVMYSDVYEGAMPDSFARNVASVHVETTVDTTTFARDNEYWSTNTINTQDTSGLFFANPKASMHIQLGAFERADVVTATKTIVHGWFLQYFRVSSNASTDTNITLGATFADLRYASDSSKVAYVSTVDPRIPVRPQEAEYRMIIDRAYIGAPDPNDTLVDYENPFAINRGELLDYSLEEATPAGKESATKTYPAIFRVGQTGRQGTAAAMLRADTSVKRLQFRMIPANYHHVFQSEHKTSMYMQLTTPFERFRNMAFSHVKDSKNYAYNTDKFFNFVQG